MDIPYKNRKSPLRPLSQVRADLDSQVHWPKSLRSLHTLFGYSSHTVLIPRILQIQPTLAHGITRETAYALLSSLEGASHERP